MLIAELRERPPRISRRQAADWAGISPTRWTLIETGRRQLDVGLFRAETGPAPIIARMAYVVGATPQQLADAGRPDAAGELEALLADITTAPFTKGQKRRLRDVIRRDLE